jgi:hypothetical protein
MENIKIQTASYRTLFESPVAQSVHLTELGRTVRLEHQPPEFKIVGEETAAKNRSEP